MIAVGENGPTTKDFGRILKEIDTILLLKYYIIYIYMYSIILRVLCVLYDYSACPSIVSQSGISYSVNKYV